MAPSCPRDAIGDTSGFRRPALMQGAVRVRGAMEGVSEPSKTPVRPPQVTVAAWMIMVGSIFVVLLVWDRIAGLHSLDTRKALQPLLDDQRIKDAGIQLT